MPVGLDSFRSPSSPTLDALRRSEALRRHSMRARRQATCRRGQEGEYLGGCDVVDRVVRLDGERRAALHELDTKRAEQRALKRRLHLRSREEASASKVGGGGASGPRDDDDDDDDGSEAARATEEELIESLGGRILHLRDHVIPAVEAELEILLPHVGNVLDETPFHDDDGDRCADDVLLGDCCTSTHRVSDPLWCLGGYDVIRPSAPRPRCVDGRGGKVGCERRTAPHPPASSRVLRGVGRDLADALRSHALSCLRRHSDSSRDYGSIGIGGKGGFGDEYHETVRLSGTTMMDPASLASVSGCDCLRPRASDDDGDAERGKSDEESSGLTHEDDTFERRRKPGDGRRCALGLRLDDGSGGVGATKDCLRGKEEKDDVESIPPPSVPMPTYVQMSMLHEGKSYSEKTLPRRFVCLCPPTSPPIDQLGRFSPSSSPDAAPSPRPREHVPCAGERIEIFVLCECELSTSRSIQEEMARRIASFHESLLVHTSSSPSGDDGMGRESGTNDDDAAAANEPCKGNRGGRGGMVRIRSASPGELLPCESRRLIVEGWSPSDARDNEDGQGGNYVKLGHVSNLTDYVSRPCGIRFASGGLGTGGGKTGLAKGLSKEYVHAVHGVFCDVGVALPWMAGCNTVAVPRQSSEVGRGIGCRFGGDRGSATTKGGRSGRAADEISGCLVPPCLIRHATEGSILRRNAEEVFRNDGRPVERDRGPVDGISSQFGWLFLPFVRRRVRGRGGKLVTQDLKITNNESRGWMIYPSRSYPSVFDSSDNDRVDDDDSSYGRPPKDDVRKREKMAEDSGTSRCHPKGGVLSLRPNHRRIVAESLCDPFSFLPFPTDHQM